MKIEIEIPELDEKEWEYVGIRQVRKGERYLDIHTGYQHEWTLERYSHDRLPCFRRRADKHAWKKGIKWPSVLKDGWVGKNPNGSVYWFKEKPFMELGGWDGFTFFKLSIAPFNLSFLPSEFWECDWRDSLVEIRHGGER